jgi:DNA-binding PadR family transcriptional regulator
VHKTLLILGLLLRGPLHGYEIHRIVRAHGALYADLKKANLYYLLDRLHQDGALTVRAEPGARGARGERLIYTLTDQGRARFFDLLRAILRSFDPVHTGVDVAVVFLAQLPPAEALALLQERRQVVGARRAQVAAELGDLTVGTVWSAIAADHLLSLIDAEQAWLDRALARLHAPSSGAGDSAHAEPPEAPGHSG